MEGKYGRLFTEEDVAKLLRLQHDRSFRAGMVEEGVGCDDEELMRPATVHDAAEGGIELRFPADEPLFLLRGQDLAAHGGAWSYAYEASRIGASIDFVTVALKAANDIRDWQEEHPDRVKVPD